MVSKKERLDLVKLATEYGAANLRFFIPMQPTHSLVAFGLPVGYTSSNDPFEVVECVIDEGRYKVADDYKIELRALDERFTSESFYLMDFESMHDRNPDDWKVFVLVDADNSYQRVA